MQRIINQAEFVVEDMLQGFIRAHSDYLEPTQNPRVLKIKEKQDKVGIVSGGGSGHKPAFIGYIGKNLLDAVAVGEVFSSPTAAAFLDAFRAADSGKGVACLYGNYAGDNMNVKMALKMAAKEGIEVRTVVANDDVASAPKGEESKRRGVAGEVLMWKVGSAMASQGASLEEVIHAAQEAIDNTRSIGIGLSPCTIPAVGHPNFTIEAGKMEVGIGHHGEPGIRVENLASATEMARLCVEAIDRDLPFQNGQEVAVLVSGLGATPVMELYIYYDAVAKILADYGVQIYCQYVGNYFTSLEMQGVTLTVMQLNEQRKHCLDTECQSMGLTQCKRG